MGKSVVAKDLAWAIQISTLGGVLLSFHFCKPIEAILKGRCGDEEGTIAHYSLRVTRPGPKDQSQK